MIIKSSIYRRRRIKLYNTKTSQIINKNKIFKQTFRTCLTFNSRESMEYVHYVAIKTELLYINLYKML